MKIDFCPGFYQVIVGIGDIEHQLYWDSGERAMTDLSESERRFMLGLTRLSKETGIIIGGCGCCGSPYLNEVEINEDSADAGYGFGGQNEVAWIEPQYRYGWKRYSETIVREKE